MKMNKSSLKLDERQRQIVRQVTAVMYLFTILYLAGAIFYREHILGQASTEFDDIAILLVINVFGIGLAVLWAGGFVIEKFRPWIIGTVYLAWVVLGTLYTVLIRRIHDWSVILEKIGIISAICAIVTIVYLGVAYLSRRRLNKNLE